MNNVLPQIGYDARLALGRYRGMGHFLRLLISGREKKLLGFCATGEQDASLNLFALGFKPYPLWEQVSLPRLVRRHKVDILLAPYNTAPLRLPKHAKLILVVHDLIFMDRMPFSRSLYQNVGRIYRRLVVPRAIERADMIVTVSNYTACQLADRFVLDKNRIRVIPNSIGEEWFSSNVAHVATPNYILVVAGEAPNKNLHRAIVAFAHCRRLSDDSNLRLKVAGVKTKFHAIYQAEARELGIVDFVDFLAFIPDTEMRCLYQRAVLFVMPSLAEGFGIPVLEAMASGVPVAASSATCLQEIGADAALYFNPYSIEEMAANMYKILTTPTLRATMSEQGRIQSKKFHSDVVKQKISCFWDEVEKMSNPMPSKGSI
jgi:glycosyltransferase involved in cell wall biosynthesis